MKRRWLPPELRMHVTRRGVVFHYYMMYLFLSSLLLTTSGLCIHAILKADHADAKVAAYLQTLLRLEGDLRHDTSQTTTVELQDTNVVLNSGDQTPSVRWSVQDNIVRRETVDGDQAVSSSRYVFARGTKLNFTWQDQQLVLNIQEAPVMPASNHGPDDRVSTKSVRIVTVIAAAAAADDGDAS